MLPVTSFLLLLQPSSLWQLLLLAGIEATGNGKNAPKPPSSRPGGGNHNADSGAAPMVKDLHWVSRGLEILRVFGLLGSLFSKDSLVRGSYSMVPFLQKRAPKSKTLPCNPINQELGSGDGLGLWV